MDLLRKLLTDTRGLGLVALPLRLAGAFIADELGTSTEDFVAWAAFAGRPGHTGLGGRKGWADLAPAARGGGESPVDSERCRVLDPTRKLDLWGVLDGRVAEPSAGAIDVWDRVGELTDPAEFRPRLSREVEVRRFQL